MSHIIPDPGSLLLTQCIILLKEADSNSVMLLLSAPRSDFPSVVIGTKTHPLTQPGDCTHKTC